MRVTSNRPAVTSSASKVPTQDVVKPETAKKAASLLKKALEKKLSDDGIVKLIGKPTITSTGTPGVVKAEGKVDVNALWGGDSKEKYTALINVNSGKVTQLKVD